MPTRRGQQVKNRKLRMGMVGGGQGAFIGEVHRMAAALDGQIELVCGAFASDPGRSRASGAELLLPPERVYGSYADMISAERTRPDGDRMDFVSIVTPNDLHLPVAKTALEAGFPVICDKPMARSLPEARELAAAVAVTSLPFGLTHNYTGYPMVRQARAMIAEGALGSIRKVVVEYPQGWLARLEERDGSKQAVWRTDPDRAGGSSCMADIGTHAENLVHFVTGLEIEALCADLTTVVEGRALEDDGSVLVRYGGGARGVLYASQISAGEENALRLRVYGEIGGVDWLQEEPNMLIAKWTDRPREILRAGVNHAHLHEDAQAVTRLPAGHPEGFIEAFANLYTDFAGALRARAAGEHYATDVPTAADGVRGMRFVEAVLESAAAGSAWVRPMGEA